MNYELENTLNNFESIYLAEEKCKEILIQIKDFQSSLSDDYEIILILPTTPLFITGISYKNPDLIIFYGLSNGLEARIIQHMSQLNFLITSRKREDFTKPANKIGFILPVSEHPDVQ